MNGENESMEEVDMDGSESDQEWRPFTQIYSTGVARVPTVVSGAFYYRLDVCNLCKLLFQTPFNYPTIIIFYLYNNIPQVNNKCIISCNHLLTSY